MKILLLLLCTLLCLSSAAELKDYLARREYGTAKNVYTQQLRRNPRDVAAARNLARVYAHEQRPDSSVAWWERALELDPLHDSSITGRWESLHRRDEHDSSKLSETRELIALEAAAFFAETTARSIAIAWLGLSLTDTVRAADAAALLCERFADSPLGHTLIGASFYDSLYPIWTNDTLRVPLIRRFLDRFPDTEWRQTFYFFLLSSGFGLRDTALVRAMAKEMVEDDPLDPFRLRYAAAILNRLKLDPQVAEEFARRAIELAPEAVKPPNKPREQWGLDYPPLLGLARLALAEALIAQERWAEAEAQLDAALAGFEWDPEQEATPGPFHCLLGETKGARADTGSALAHLVRALEVGDSRNTWTARADSGLKRLGSATEHEQVELGRGLLSYAGARFADVTGEYGLGGRMESRVAWGDYNNDGYEDLLLNGCRLFRNDSGIGFTDVTDLVGLSSARGRGGVWADYDNDGWLDFYMSGADTVDQLWRNGQGLFRDVTKEAGNPSDPHPTEGVAWADYDNDGWVDLYCANYEDWATHTYFPDRLYRNENGVFADRTALAGINPPYGKHLAGRGVSWADFDGDGFPDCFVSNYRLTENLFWTNNRNSTFSNLAGQLGVSGDEVDGWYGHTIGAAWADYDNDGDLDLFTADLAHPRYIEFSNRSRLYDNRGPKAYPRFYDRRAESGIRYEETHSDPAWADVDNDGDLDLYITSIYEGRRSFLYENRLEVRKPNSINPLFSEITWLSGTRAYNGWGCAFADFDNDGDMDLVVGSGSGLRLFRNDIENGHHWLKVKVVGTRANRAGIGARVSLIEKSGRRQVREVEGGKGTTSQNSLVQHFGLSGSNAPVTIEVRFAPGRIVRRKDVRPDRLITVTEP